MSFQYPDHPFIIAEMSGNHNQSVERGFEIIEAAKKAGADAVKIQTYTADTITLDHDGPEFIVDMPMWKGRKMYDLYQEAHTPWLWHKDLFAKAAEIGITIFSTPFDETAVDFLESLGNPIYKIASFELVDTPLIKYAAQTGKPLIMSTGMGTVAEITDAVEAARAGGCKDLTLLHCVSAYPAPIEQCNLATMVELGRLFPDVKIGLSDHTMGIAVPDVAVALGARVIEKHFTLARADGGVDSAFSLEPDELAALCQSTKSCKDMSSNETYAKALGVVDFEKAREEGGRALRPSIYVTKDMKAGDAFSAENIRTVRPSNGLLPKEMENVLGRTAAQDIAFGTPLAWDKIL